MATVAFFDGITDSWLVLELAELELLELLELLDELLLELGGGGRQGGTISVTTLLLAGSTSWSCGCAPAAEAPEAPPGVTRMVLAGGGAIVALLLELLELELLELELDGDPHGSTATVCVSVLRGITISLEPGGMLLLPDCTTAASEHEVTAIVSGLCCWGMTTVRTPGLCRAAATGSWLELLLELPPLLPQPVIATTAMHVTKAATGRVAAARLLFMLSSGASVDIPTNRGLGAPVARLSNASPQLPHYKSSRNRVARWSRAAGGPGLRS